LGAAHFLEKPVSLETLAELAARAGLSTAITPVLAAPMAPAT
jgi:FixJ family two-component response regulator